MQQTISSPQTEMEIGIPLLPLNVLDFGDEVMELNISAHAYAHDTYTHEHTN